MQPRLDASARHGLFIRHFLVESSFTCLTLDGVAPAHAERFCTHCAAIAKEYATMRGGFRCGARQTLTRAHTKAGWITGAALVVLFGCRGAFAEPCVMINRPLYNLVTDTVNWSMRVGSRQNCHYGVRYAKVQLERMTLVFPPRAGQVVLQGSAFIYIPRKDFQGDDSFLGGRGSDPEGMGLLDNSRCCLCRLGDEIAGTDPRNRTGPDLDPARGRPDLAHARAEHWRNNAAGQARARTGSHSDAPESRHGGPDSCTATRHRSRAHADPSAARCSAGAHASRSVRLISVQDDQSRQNSLIRFGAGAALGVSPGSTMARCVGAGC